MSTHNSTLLQYGSVTEMIESVIRKNWDILAFSDLGGMNYRYRDVAEQVEKLHIIFESAGLKPGDRIALCGRNSSNWAVCFIACLTAGMVAVPLLHEFKAETITHLVNHSESKLLFVDANIWEHLNAEDMPGIKGAIYLAEFGMPLSRDPKIAETRSKVNEYFGQKYPADYTKEDMHWHSALPGELAVINYTSGSTGMSKGVMLSYRSIWSNLRFCNDNIDYMKKGDAMVNMLPLAHMYGMIIEMLFPFTKGAHCVFLTKAPSPAVLLGAFAEVKPKLIITVPLVLEKIIKSKIFPLLEKPMMKILLKVPFLDDHLLAKIKEGLMQAFGGNLHELIIGGAALNKDVASFLTRIGFPYTVGYGMTECGPLISYSPPTSARFGSVGRPVDRLEVKIDSPDPEKITGNIMVRGANVMEGYFKNPEATAEVMGKDGWMNTGDLGLMDSDGYIYIMGRSKTMILGPSGQNIYPEEIEQKLNNLPYVLESLVVDRDGKLVALVMPDHELLEKSGIAPEAVGGIMEDNLKQLNQEMPGYSKVSKIELMEHEFEKTPKRSIKRYLYS